jgi:alpha-L-fucosidase 2
MRRRDFLKKSSAAAIALAGSQKMLQASTAGVHGQQDSSQVSGPPAARTAVVYDQGSLVAHVGSTPESAFLPKPPLMAQSLLPAKQRTRPMPLDERVRRGVVPKRGMCSVNPGRSTREGLVSGNGPVYVEVACDPFSEQVLFHHDRLMLPWKRPFEAPKVASILPDLRKLILAGKYREAVDMAFNAMNLAGLPVNEYPHATISAFLMHLEIPEEGAAENYLRTTDFECGEIKVYWTDQRGEWVRQIFASGPDNVIAQRITAPKDQLVSVKIAIVNPPFGPRADGGPITFEQDANEHRIIFKGHFDPAVNNNGYAGVTRVICTGGSAHIEDGALAVEGAQSVTLLTRIEWYPDFTQDQVDALVKAVDQVDPDYATLLARHRQIQAPIFNRVAVDFGGGSQQALAGEELIDDQRTRTGFSPALLEKLFDMGRYWLIVTAGNYFAEINININLQVAPGVMGNMPEAMGTFYDWVESALPDCRKNAENIFGARGAVFPILPSWGLGVSFHYAVSQGYGIWPHPYWISGGGWCYSPFWDHYLVSGDQEFLRKRIVPGLKELALFYEDFLTVTDERGNYVFVPSFSPENAPLNSEPLPLPQWPGLSNRDSPVRPPTTLVVNATLDIAMCREVLSHLIEASEILGTDLDEVPKWKAMLAKLPPYLLDPDGMLKEWTWASLQDNCDHRHVSHLYGVWPGDEIDPDRTPKLAKAALLADRKRTPETLAAHGLCHRALVGARLKDSYLVQSQMKQLLEQGYVAATIRTSHNPYLPPMPDAQGALPTIMMEMLVYSRPGVIELLPALPDSLGKGAVNGVLARSFAKVDTLAWDLEARSADVSITSLKDQNITLIVRYGIGKISAPPGVLAKMPDPDAISCDLHLPKGKPVRLHLALGRHKPLDWVDQVSES